MGGNGEDSPPGGGGRTDPAGRVTTARPDGASRALDGPVHTLPVQMSPFVGREHELTDLVERLGTARLVTLTGVGGIGKTRLAVEAGFRMLEQQEDGVWWVDLSALRDPALVLPAAASALGLMEEARRPLRDTVLASLRYRDLLLVLDNCEHLLAAAASLAGDVLAACPGVRIMATSREPLGRADEVVVAVPPLHDDAVELFMERAGAARPGFRLDADDTGVIEEICRRLDGIPLAIELAAARIRVLGPQDLAERLGDRFSLLGSNPRGPARQQTLRAVLDWSYDLLEPDERTVFGRLAAFSGGFTIDAAEDICAGGTVERGRLLELLARLVDKSLVVVTDVGGRVRYQRIDTVRIYARERLSASGEEADVRRRHAAWYLALARSGSNGTDVGGWLDRMETEHDNLRIALAWVMEPDPETALELVVAAAPFWEQRGHLTEGRQWVQDALTWGAGAPPALRSAATEAAGSLASAQGDYPTARTLFERCREQCASAGDRTGAARVLGRLGLVARYEGRFAEAEELLHQAVDGYRELGDVPGTAGALADLGQVAGLRGERATARFLYRESLGLYRQAGDDGGAARVLVLLGQQARLDGDLEEARRCHDQGLAAYRRRRDLRGVADALTALGHLARQEDDFPSAIRMHTEAMAIYEELSDLRGRASSLASLGFIAYMTGDQEGSERLYREAVALRRRLGDRRGLAVALNGVANAVFLRSSPPPDMGYARELVEEALAIQHEIGDRTAAAWSAYCLSEITRDLGDADTSRAHAEESLALFREVGDDRHSGLAYYSLGELARAEGDVERAGALAAESLRRAREVGTGLQLVRCVELAAGVVSQRGDLPSAALLFGAAQSAREHLRLPPRERQDDQLKLIATLAADPGHDLSASWDTGRGLTLGEAAAAAGVALSGGTAPAGPEAGRPARPDEPTRSSSGRLGLLGGFSVTWDGTTASPPPGVASQALKALALRGPLHVEELAELLWPEAPPGSGRRRLHNVVSRLRKSFDGLVVRDGETLSIAPDVTIDVELFEAAAAAALTAADAEAPGAEQLLESAIPLYAGELLPADRFEPWTVRRREAFFQLYLRLIHALSRAAADRQDVSKAVEWLERAMELDPFDEATYAAAARLLIERGWRARARAVLRRAREVAAELEVDPSAEILRLEAALRD